MDVAERTVAKKPNELERLFYCQDETRDLLQRLEVKLETVSHPQPQEAGIGGLSDARPHITLAVENQANINNRIKYLLDALVV